jgi:hypothetical protein
MAEESGSAGLGLIVGIIAVVVVLILAFGVGPIVFKSGPSTNLTIEAPQPPTPAPQG